MTMYDKPKVVFVDDEERVLHSIRGLFRRNYELFLTTEGESAIKFVSENSIDVIVADQRMPGVTGVEVLEKVKSLSPRTVRILLTGYADLDAIEHSINVGEVFRFLSKPCAPKLLRETLEVAVAAARETRGSTDDDVDPVEKTVGSQPRPVRRDGATIEHVRARIDQIANSSVIAPYHDNRPPRATRASREEIALLNDSSGAISPSRQSTTTLVDTSDVGVAVFTVNPQFAEIAIRAISRDRDTILATKLIKVAEVLEDRSAGVLITDFTSDTLLLRKIIGALKKRMPELVAIVVSEVRDSNEMISLINNGQIFRYRVKPVGPQILIDDVEAAAAKHVDLRDNPESMIRHQVLDLPILTNTSDSVNQFFGKVSNLRSSRYDSDDSSG